MNFRFIYFALMLCCLISIAGCTQKDKKKPVDPNAPPPPTAQEIAQKIILDAKLDIRIPGPEARFPIPQRNAMLSKLRNLKTKHSADPVGKEALDHVVSRIDKRIRDSRQAGAWQYVTAFIDAYAIFRPNSKKYGSLKDEALTELRKPRVTVTGLPVIKNRQLIKLSLYIPIEDRSYKEQVEIGDEIHGLKVLDIFGQNRGVVLEYLETGERFNAFMPGQK